jgi:hypothetical protein
MPIAFSISLFLAVLGCVATAEASGTSPRAGTSTVAAPAEQGSKRELVVRSASGTQYRVQVMRDDTVNPAAQPSEVQLIGESKDVALVVVDSYPSRPGGLSYCQAGKERFLRIISVAQKPPRETFRVKLESCRDNIELASPGIEWLPSSTAVRINWLLGPAKKGQPETRTLRIDREGKPT